MVAERGCAVNVDVNSSTLNLDLSDSDYFLSDIDSPKKNQLEESHIKTANFKPNIKRFNPFKINASAEAKPNKRSTKFQCANFTSSTSSTHKNQTVEPKKNKITLEQYREKYRKNTAPAIKSIIQRASSVIESAKSPNKKTFVSVATSPIKFSSPLCKCKRQNRARNQKKRDLAKRALQFAREYSEDFQ